MTAYVHSLNSPPVAYDAYLAGQTDALSDEALAGLRLFEGKANCSSCHSGALLSDGKFHNTGVGTTPHMFDHPERQLAFRRFFRTLGLTGSIVAMGLLCGAGNRPGQVIGRFGGHQRGMIKAAH